MGSPRSRREMRGSFWSPAGVEQLRASMDASGFAYQHSRLRLRQGFRATDEPRNSAVVMDGLSGSSPKPTNRDRPPLFRELRALNPQQHVARS